MSERGGTTTQSGIYYQNSVTALFLGRLCDMRKRRRCDRVAEVRVEAPAYVDDIVVTYVDHHRDWIQAKESISKNDEAWKKLWRDFEAQRWNEEFGVDDRLVLVAGSARGTMHHDLRALAARTGGKTNHEEWKNALSKRMLSLLDSIRELLHPEHQDDESLFVLFSSIDVWPLCTLEQIERDYVPLWMPPSNTEPHTLLALLRDQVGGYARYRKAFHARRVLEELASEHHVSIDEPRSYGVPAYRDTLVQLCDRIEVPGTSLSGSIDDLFLWPTLRETRPDLLREGTPEEDLRYSLDGQRGTIDLKHFPHTTLERVVVVAGAGFGKTALLTAIAHHLAQTDWLPALIPLPELAETEQTVMEFLKDSVNRHFNVAIPWDHYCDSGRAVILFDGLDELAPGDRQRMLGLIKKFSSRYRHPQVPWILTVRDATALPGPAGAKTLIIDTFDHDQIAAFAAAYRKGGSTVEPRELLSQLERHRDLELLARIPLFLALLLATTGPSESLPRKRSDLLKRYLYVLLHPKEYKPSIRLQCDPTELREVAEHLAFMALEREQTVLTERDVSQISRQAPGKLTTDAYIGDLTACGVLRCSADLIRFAFPTVQEYLAACYLARYLPDQLVEKFKLSVKRPWSQSLQFALEQHPEADQIINRLLEQPDDAFGTGLRLIGRCIVNGALVSANTRNRVGDRLADLWTWQSWQIRRNIGQLLADGFTSPLPARVRALLEQGWGLGSGGDEIVAACNDPDLTRAVLRAFLNSNLEYKYYLHNWQPAVDLIASETLQHYIARVKAERTTRKEIEAIASLIRNLSPEYLPPQAYQSVTEDTTLPHIVRLAGYFLGPRPILQGASKFVDEIIRSPKAEGEYSVPGWRLALDALWYGDSSVDRWRAYACDISLPEERRRQVLFAVLDGPFQARTQITLLAELQPDDALSTDLRQSILLVRAYLGDSEAMKEVTDLMASLSFENLASWALVASKHHSGDIVRIGLRNLAHIPLQPDQKVWMASDLSFGLTMDVQFVGQVAGSSGAGRVLHPAAPDCAEMVWQWASEYDGGEEGCLRLLTAACELGHHGAAKELAGEVTCVIHENADLFEDFGFDHTVSNALYALDRVQHILPLEVLRHCAVISDSNAAIQAISMIASYASHEALTALIQLYHSKAEWDARDSIVTHIEQLASRLGVRLVWEGDQLVRQT